jgi:CHAD domain-containing protein
MNDAAAMLPSAPPSGLPESGRPEPAPELLGSYLAAQAGVFLRGLPLPAADTPEAERLPAALRRVGAVLHTFEPLLDRSWAVPLRAELAWLLGVVTAETAQIRRLTRLLAGLDALTAPSSPPADGPADGREPRAGLLAQHPGAPKARGLIERQLTVSRARARSGALQELGSARFHALADRMTLLTSELPQAADLDAALDGSALLGQLFAAYQALCEGVQGLPPARLVGPYNGEALRGVTAIPPESGEPADGIGWSRVRVLASRVRYALELCAPVLGAAATEPSDRLTALSRLLGEARDAADAAETAATAARTPRITPATAYVLGVLHADQRLDVEAAHYTFGRAWSELTTSNWHQRVTCGT